MNALYSLSGRGTLDILGGREATDCIATYDCQPGDLVLLRSPGLNGVPDGRPLHRLQDVAEGARHSLALRMIARGGQQARWCRFRAVRAVRSLPIDDFVEHLAAEQPTPGGGSAAAFAGATGAALVSMTCRYTVGRERYRDVEQEMAAVLERSEELRGELQALVQDDVEAYGSYAEAQSLPRGSEDETRARHDALAAAMRASTDAPLAVAERSAELIDLALRAARAGNPWLISDAAVGAQFALTGYKAAALNVELNLTSVDDPNYVEECNARLAQLGGQRLHARVDETVATVRSRHS